MAARAPKTSEVLERMRRTATRDATTRADGVQLVASAPATRARVRYTLDLSGRQHHFLKRFALDAGVEASKVMRVLLSLLEDDAEVARRVAQQLRNGVSE